MTHDFVFTFFISIHFKLAKVQCITHKHQRVYSECDTIDEKEIEIHVHKREQENRLYQFA